VEGASERVLGLGLGFRFPGVNQHYWMPVMAQLWMNLN